MSDIVNDQEIYRGILRRTQYEQERRGNSNEALNGVFRISVLCLECPTNKSSEEEQDIFILWRPRTQER